MIAESYPEVRPCMHLRFRTSTHDLGYCVDDSYFELSESSVHTLFSKGYSFNNFKNENLHRYDVIYYLRSNSH